jgi:hypothetical protein
MYVKKRYPRAGTNVYIGFHCVYDHMKDDGVEVLILGQGWSTREAWAYAAKKIKDAPIIKALKKQRDEIDEKLAAYEGCGGLNSWTGF